MSDTQRRTERPAPAIDVPADTDLYVWWCPHCNKQTERFWHIARRGDPLIPQNDEEHYCVKVAVVPKAQLEELQQAAEEVVRIEMTGVLPDFMPLAAAVARTKGKT